MGSSEAAFCGVLQGRRGDASRWARPRRLFAGFCRAAETMLADGLVRGGFLRGFPTAALRAAPPFPFVLLSPAARGTDAARPFPPMRTGGQSLPFSTFSYRPAVLLSLPSRPANDAARHFSCILLSRRAAGTAPLSLPPARAAEQCAPFSPYRRRARHCTSFSTPRRPGNGCRASVPAHANRRAVPSLFHIFLPPGRTSFFTQPSCQRCRAPLFLHPFVPPGGRDSAAFFAACTGGGAVRSLFALSAARPALHLFFCTPPPGERMPRVRSRPCEPAGSPFYFHSFPRASRASGRRPRTAHPPCSCARLLLFAAAPAASLLRFPPRFAFRAAHSCARVPSAPVSSVPRRLVPRRRALYPALFLRGRTHRAVLSPFPSRAARLSCPAPPVRPACAHRVEAGEAVKPAAARSCTPGPVPARADASRRSFAFPLARRAPFLPCAPCAPGLCASRRGDGRSASPARPACVETTHSKSPARQRIPARPACMPAPRTPGASVPPRTPGASVPPRAAVRFGSHPAVQARPIFFHRQAGKRTQKANLIRTYVRIRF